VKGASWAIRWTDRNFRLTAKMLDRLRALRLRTFAEPSSAERAHPGWAGGVRPRQSAPPILRQCGGYRVGPAGMKCRTDHPRKLGRGPRVGEV